MKEGDRFYLRTNSVLYKLFGDRPYRIEQVDVVPNNKDNTSEVRVLFYIGGIMYFELENHIRLIPKYIRTNMATKKIKKFIIEFEDGTKSEYNKPKNVLTNNKLIMRDTIYPDYCLEITPDNINE